MNHRRVLVNHESSLGGAIAGSGRVRRTSLNGRSYLVAPLTLIVPGTLTGSKGSLYYPPEEIAQNVEGWNYTPIVVYHPVAVDGRHVSARDPNVLQKQQIGQVRKATLGRGGRLVAEGWFDAENTRRVDPRVLRALEAGQPIELSTGLYTDNMPAPANSVDDRGRGYDHIARNYRGDHVAVLPDQVGACSLHDGCGVLAANRRKKVEQWSPLWNAFCPTGTGGGVDPSCAPSSGEYKTAAKASNEVAVKTAVEQSKTWEKNLEDDEKEALIDYTLDSSLNDRLRSGSTASYRDKNAMELLDSSLEKSTLPQPTTLFRGVEGKSFKVGETFSDDGYTSASKNVHTAEEFSQGGSVFEMKLPKGFNAAYIARLSTSYGSEGEFLMPRGLTFKVTSKSADDRYVVEPVANQKRDGWQPMTNMWVPFPLPTSNVSILDKQNRVRSLHTGQFKPHGSGVGKGDSHEAAQRGHLMLSIDDHARGADAAAQAQAGHNPPSWVDDEDKWEKAKVAADKGNYEQGTDQYWAVVTHIYQRMGGTMKSKEQATENQWTPFVVNWCNQYGGTTCKEGSAGAKANAEKLGSGTSTEVKPKERKPTAASVALAGPKEKVSKIAAEVAETKKKLAALLGDLKGAKADLTTVKATVVKKVSARSESNKAKVAGVASELINMAHQHLNSSMADAASRTSKREAVKYSSSSEGVKAQTEKLMSGVSVHALARALGLSEKHASVEKAKEAIHHTIVGLGDAYRRSQK